MRYKFIFILIIALGSTSCKNKPKKSMEELPVKVNIFDKDAYSLSQLDSNTLGVIKSFGSIVDTLVYKNELDSISDILNKNKDEEIYHTSSGVVYIIDEYGDGNYPVKGDLLQVQVETSTLTGKKIFSTSDLKQSLQFILGVGQVVPAWDEVFLNVQEGTSFEIISPSALSYGKKGFIRSVNPNTILKYNIVFEKIINSKTAPLKDQPHLKINDKVKNKDKNLDHQLPITIKRPEKL